MLMYPYLGRFRAPVFEAAKRVVLRRRTGHRGAYTVRQCRSHSMSVASYCLCSRELFVCAALERRCVPQRP